MNSTTVPTSVTTTKQVVTQTTKDANGNVTTVVTTSEKTSSNPDDHPFFVQKVYGSSAYKRSKAVLKKELVHTLNIYEFQHNLITDDPVQTPLNNEVMESDIHFMHLKEVEDDDIKPRYWVFNGVESCKGVGHKEDTMMCECKDCYVDTWCKYLFGPFYVAIVKRYFEEKPQIAIMREAYVHYLSTYNRQLDLHSYKNSNKC